MVKVIAFDLDGTLQTQKGLEFYRRQMNRSDTKIGILTAGSKREAERFVDEKNLESDFIMRGAVKSVRLVWIARRMQGDGKHIYVGDRITDMIAAKIAGWEFKSINDI